MEALASYLLDPTSNQWKICHRLWLFGVNLLEANETVIITADWGVYHPELPARMRMGFPADNRPIMMCQIPDVIRLEAPGNVDGNLKIDATYLKMD